MKNKNFESKFDRALRKHFDILSNNYSNQFKVGDNVIHIMGDYTGTIVSINKNRFDMKILSIGENCISSDLNKIGDIIKNLPLDSYKILS